MRAKAKDFHQTAAYKKLIREVRKYLDETRLTGSKAATKQKLAAYWQIGKRLVTIDSFTKRVVSGIANDALTDPTLLYRCRQFFEAWPKGVKGEAATVAWTTHNVIAAIPDTKLRQFYLRQTLTQGWNRDTLANAVEGNYFDKHDEGILPFVAPEIDPMFVYVGYVERVIDGDTIEVLIDAGFKMWTKQRVRLNGINCAEILRDPSPDAARQFVIDKLKDVKFILIKTRKSDLYGRYLGDVYYHPTLTTPAEIIKNGFHLNRQLIEAGLAKPMLV